MPDILLEADFQGEQGFVQDQLQQPRGERIPKSVFSRYLIVGGYVGIGSLSAMGIAHRSMFKIPKLAGNVKENGRFRHAVFAMLFSPCCFRQPRLLESHSIISYLPS
jgi:hypothetical protein